MSLPPPRVLLVTGASSGIGRAAAHQAAARGDHLVLAARDEVTLKETAVECDAAGAASTLVVPTDVGDDDAVAACVRQVLDRHGRLDGVAHCAGVVAYGRVEDVPPELFEGVLRTNLLGSVNIARHVLPVLRGQGRGALVLVGSVVGHLAVPGMSPYVVSKWGVRALARQLQVENRDQAGVSVSLVSPGGVLTPIYEQAANYRGWAGRPPPPVDSPEKVARVVLDRIDHPRKRTQVGELNNVMRFGFTFAPRLYDALVGPLFRFAALDLTRPLPPVAGNVLRPVPERNRVRGHQVGALVGISRNVVAGARRLGPGSDS
ncbi:MAG TPA: SDR family NAD(P)-dependent oxidoreductase [Marmoricola sp.]|nr:SDR family NAD(P)-dependent oxidoreductase [Marmoricola sp.]